MLRRLSVSGFRSFDDFEFELRPGLNVLVGPNGSGKSNFINFLEFLSHLARGSLPEAFSRIGGAGDAFRRQISPYSQQLMSISVGGHGWFSSGRRRERERSYVQYEYSATIELSIEKSAVFFNKQRIKCSIAPSPDSIREQWDVDLEALSDKEGNIQSKIHRLKKEAIEERGLLKEPFSAAGVKKYLDDSIDVANAVPLFQIYDYIIPSFEKVFFDLYPARLFNIDPRMAKQSEDVANEPGIKPDGRGLAATLYFLKTGGQERRMIFSPYPLVGTNKPPNQILKQIIEYSRLVNDSVVDIDVVGDSIENKLKIFIDTRYDQSHIRMPFAMASDGTAKWLTLITAILTSEGIFSIEEPENFLHPLMQREIVNIVRETFEQNAENFAVMSTHSETMINSVRPEELIIVSIKDGVTRAKRPSNSEEVIAEIEKTPFGLSYYYLAGALD